MFNFEPQAPIEYRPYLGPESVVDDPEEKRLREKIHKKQLKKKPKSGKPGFFKRYSMRMEEKRNRRRKRKHKKRIKKNQIRSVKKENRIEYIRKFFPQYKRTSEDWMNLSWEDDSDEREKFRHGSYFKYVVNSVVLFIIAYLAVYILYQFSVLVVAANWKLDSVLLYYDLAFNDYSPLWNRRNIILVTFSGPFLALILGFLFMRYFSKRPKFSKKVRLFMLWMGLHGFNFFLGAFASGVSFDEGFGYVPAWLFMNIFWKILLSMTFLFLLGVIGYHSVPRFLDTSYSITRVKSHNKNKFLFSQVILPWIIGSVIIFLIKIPNNMPYDVGILITMMFAVIPVLFNTRARPTHDFKVEKKPNTFNYMMMVVMVVAVLLYRIGLDNGLHFELFYDFIFTLEVNPN